MRTILLGRRDVQVAEELANYFNAVSREFDPLAPGDIPHGRPQLKVFEVTGRIQQFCKPKSMVKGDIFPALMTQFSNFLAIPLTSNYNTISDSFSWPRI